MSYPFIPAVYTLASSWARNGEPANRALRMECVRGLTKSERCGLSLAASCKLAEDLAVVFRARRDHRNKHRLMARGALAPDSLALATERLDRNTQMPRLPAPTGRAPVRLPAGTPAERLQSAREKAVMAANPMRRGAAGGGSVTARLTSDPAEVSYKVELDSNHNTYRGKYKGYSATEDHHTITVPADWRVRVERRNLAVVDGLFTLDAAPLEGAPEGVELFAAVWAAQARGYAVSVARGFIARAGDVHHHADTPEKALAGLRRKVAGAAWVATVKHARIDSLVSQNQTVSVRISDARAMGACEYGIRSWCNAVGLRYEAGIASVDEVWAGYLKYPAPEARAAILHALRRAKRLRIAA